MVAVVGGVEGVAGVVARHRLGRGPRQGDAGDAGRRGVGRRGGRDAGAARSARRSAFGDQAAADGQAGRGDVIEGGDQPPAAAAGGRGIEPHLGVARGVAADLDEALGHGVAGAVAGLLQGGPKVDGVAGRKVGDVARGAPRVLVEDEGVVPAAAGHDVPAASDVEGVHAGSADQMVAVVGGIEGVPGVVAGDGLSRGPRQGDGGHAGRGRIGGVGGRGAGAVRRRAAAGRSAARGPASRGAAACGAAACGAAAGRSAAGGRAARGDGSAVHGHGGGGDAVEGRHQPPAAAAARRRVEPHLGVARGVAADLEVALGHRVARRVAGPLQRRQQVDGVAGVEVGDLAVGAPGVLIEDEGVVAAAPGHHIPAAADVEGVSAGPADQVVAVVGGMEDVALAVPGDRLRRRAGQGDGGDAGGGRVGRRRGRHALAARTRAARAAARANGDVAAVHVQAPGRDAVEREHQGPSGAAGGAVGIDEDLGVALAVVRDLHIAGRHRIPVGVADPVHDRRHVDRVVGVEVGDGGARGRDGLEEVLVVAAAAGHRVAAADVELVVAGPADQVVAVVVRIEQVAVVVAGDRLGRAAGDGDAVDHGRRRIGLRGGEGRRHDGRVDLRVVGQAVDADVVDVEGVGHGGVDVAAPAAHGEVDQHVHRLVPARRGRGLHHGQAVDVEGGGRGRPQHPVGVVAGGVLQPRGEFVDPVGEVTALEDGVGVHPQVFHDVGFAGTVVGILRQPEGGPGAGPLGQLGPHLEVAVLLHERAACRQHARAVGLAPRLVGLGHGQLGGADGQDAVVDRERVQAQRAAAGALERGGGVDLLFVVAPGLVGEQGVGRPAQVGLPGPGSRGGVEQRQAVELVVEGQGADFAPVERHHEVAGLELVGRHVTEGHGVAVADLQHRVGLAVRAGDRGHGRLDLGEGGEAGADQTHGVDGGVEVVDDVVARADRFLDVVLAEAAHQHVVAGAAVHDVGVVALHDDEVVQAVADAPGVAAGEVEVLHIGRQHVGAVGDDGVHPGQAVGHHHRVGRVLGIEGDVAVHVVDEGVVLAAFGGNRRGAGHGVEGLVVAAVAVDHGLARRALRHRVAQIVVVGGHFRQPPNGGRLD